MSVTEVPALLVREAILYLDHLLLPSQVLAISLVRLSLASQCLRKRLPEFSVHRGAPSSTSALELVLPVLSVRHEVGFSPVTSVSPLPSSLEVSLASHSFGWVSLPVLALVDFRSLWLPDVLIRIWSLAASSLLFERSWNAREVHDHLEVVVVRVDRHSRPS